MGLIIKRIVNKPIDSNCYVLYTRELKTCLIIDPGTKECEELTFFLTEQNLNPEYILLTHEHFDHIWGVNFLKDRYNCKIVTSRECANKIIDKKKNMSIFYNQIGFETYSSDIPFDDNSYNLDWQDQKITLFKTMGHSDGSICFKINNYLFTGDSLIKDLKTVTKFPSSSRMKLIDSIKTIKSYCDNQTIFYPGHGSNFEFFNYDLNKAL